MNDLVNMLSEHNLGVNLASDIIPFFHNRSNKPSRQTLSKALEMSKKARNILSFFDFLSAHIPCRVKMLIGIRE
jgi:hypothetical protein